MSTFGGKIQEIPNISVDRFDGSNLKSEAYFLSHCHSDHMVGLNNNFGIQLIEKEKYLYASEISCTILKQMYPNIKNNLRVLSLNTPETISLKNVSFSVTLIPAGHCPGSVMFLFENGKRILYTGDYRINENDIKKFLSFYDTHGRVKLVDKLYLDTTFFSKKYLTFPKRKESHTQLCDILKKFIKDSTTYINIHTSAKYGYEYVFKEIFKHTGMPIHVGTNAFRFYSLVPELDSAVTLEATKTRIHSHCGEKFGQICIYDETAEIQKIRMSAMRWTQDSESVPEFGTHYICYSTHASYEEGAALINFLKPKDIEICVKHLNDPQMNSEIENLVQQHLNELKIKSTENELIVPKLFNTKKRKEVSSSTSVEFNELFSFDLAEEVQKSTVDSGIQQPDEKGDFGNQQSYVEIEDSTSNDAIKNEDMPKDNKEDESVLYNILFSPPESSVCINDNEVENSVFDNSDEEDSVIYRIINSSPTFKRKSDK